MKHFASFALACALVLTAGISAASSADAFPKAKPETVGFSTERLQRLAEAMHATVDKGEISGMVTLVTRHGKLVYSDVYGVQDIATKQPMTQDTIFRIYSMTKPITGVAMMMLYEEGKWLPEDPIARTFPSSRI